MRFSCAVNYLLEKFKTKLTNRKSSTVAASTSALAVSACGGGPSGSETQVKDFLVPMLHLLLTMSLSQTWTQILKFLRPPILILLGFITGDGPVDFHITPMLENFERVIY